MGKIGRGKTFFLKAFGETTDEFRELLLMPEYIIRNRFDCEASGETDRWRDAFAALCESDLLDFKKRLMENDFKIRDESNISRELQHFLSFYQSPNKSVPKLSIDQKQRMVAAFDEKWRDRAVRLSEDEITHSMKKMWLFRLK